MSPPWRDAPVAWRANRARAERFSALPAQLGWGPGLQNGGECPWCGHGSFHPPPGRRPWRISTPAGAPGAGPGRGGGLVIVPLLALAAIPVVLTILMAMGWLLICGLGLWALIKAWAGFEPWMNSDSRFQQ